MIGGPRDKISRCPLCKIKLTFGLGWGVKHYMIDEIYQGSGH
jgi:hypothetical protein